MADHVGVNADEEQDRDAGRDGREGVGVRVAAQVEQVLHQTEYADSEPGDRSVFVKPAQERGVACDLNQLHCLSLRCFAVPHQRFDNEASLVV